MPRLFELHDLARERGLGGYRRMSKAELARALGVELNGAGGDEPPAAAGPTEIERAMRRGYALLTLRGADNALSLEALEQLAEAVEQLAEDPHVRLVAITGAGSRLCSMCNRVRFIDSIHLFSRDRHEEIRL